MRLLSHRGQWPSCNPNCRPRVTRAARSRACLVSASERRSGWRSAAITTNAASASALARCAAVRAAWSCAVCALTPFMASQAFSNSVSSSTCRDLSAIAPRANSASWSGGAVLPVKELRRAAAARTNNSSANPARISSICREAAATSRAAASTSFSAVSVRLLAARTRLEPRPIHKSASVAPIAARRSV